MTIDTAKTPDEQERIFRFRYTIYVEEMGKPMPGADHVQRTLRDELDNHATHLYALRGGEIMATLRIFWGRDGIPPQYKAWYGLHGFDSSSQSDFSFTGRMMVAGAVRGGTAALALATEAYRLGRLSNVAFDFIHTTPPLIPFFERLGHRRYTTEFIDPDLGPRTPMVLTLDDLTHLKAQGSPFLKLGRKSTPPVGEAERITPTLANATCAAAA